MSAEIQNASGDLNQEASGPSNEEKTLSYESYQRAIGEKKKMQEKLARISKEAERSKELEAKLQEYERKELEAKGSYEEATRKLQEALAEERNKYKSLALSTRKLFVHNKVKDIALKHGANPNAVDDILKVESWDDVEIDDNLSPNEETIEEKIARLSKDKPYFFAKSGGQIKDVTFTKAQGTSGKSFKEMNNDELVKALKQAGGVSQLKLGG